MAPNPVLAKLTKTVLAIAVLAAAIAATAGTAPAAAQGSGVTGSNGAGYEDRYVFAGYEHRPEAVSTVDRTRPRGPTRWCVHWPIHLPSALAEQGTQIEELTGEEVRDLSRATRGPLVVGERYFLLCYRAGEDVPYRVTVIEFDRRDPTGAAVTTIETVSEYARRLVDVPPTAFTTSPPPDRLVVGLETWLTTPNPFEFRRRSAQAGPLWATATAVPVAITYALGDGTVLRCGGPPPPSPPGVSRDQRPDCARHTYLDSRSDSGVGQFTVAAEVTYDIWLITSENSSPRHVDTMAGPVTELPVTVREIQAVIR